MFDKKVSLVFNQNPLETSYEWVPKTLNIHVLTRRTGSWLLVWQRSQRSSSPYGRTGTSCVSRRRWQAVKSSVFQFIVCLFACCVHIWCFCILFYT